LGWNTIYRPGTSDLRMRTGRTERLGTRGSHFVTGDHLSFDGNYGVRVTEVDRGDPTVLLPSLSSTSLSTFLCQVRPCRTPDKLRGLYCTCDLPVVLRQSPECARPRLRQPGSRPASHMVCVPCIFAVFVPDSRKPSYSLLACLAPPVQILWTSPDARSNS